MDKLLDHPVLFNRQGGANKSKIIADITCVWSLVEVEVKRLQEPEIDLHTLLGGQLVQLRGDSIMTSPSTSLWTSLQVTLVN